MMKMQLLAVTIIGLTYGGVTNAAVVDGIIGVDEYASGVTITLGFGDETGNHTGIIPGSFSYVIEGGLIFAALSAPTDFTDNVYGTDSAAAGWDGGRDFNKLLGSDRLLFGLDTNVSGGTVISVVIDYLAQVDSTKTSGFNKLDLKGSNKGSDASDSVNDLSASAYTQGTSDTGPSPYRAVFGVTTGNVIQEVATSLEFNLNQGGACGDTTNSGLFPGNCSAVLTYEWSMLASAFDSFTASNILSPLMHSSPSKLSHGSVYEPDCFTTNDSCDNVDVPEPGSLAVVLAGLVCLGWTRRRRQAS